LQLAPEQRKALIFLVDHHITLSSVAQRRNLKDAATVAEFAALVKSQENLDALMLLTLADGRGTGDENWSDWKETLVWTLYRHTSLYLADGEAYHRQRRVGREQSRKAVFDKMPEGYHEEVDAHFENMPDRYCQTYTVEEIIEHIRLFRQFLKNYQKRDTGPLAPAVRWVPHTNFG